MRSMSLQRAHLLRRQRAELPPIRPVLIRRPPAEHQEPATPGAALRIVPDPPPPGAQQPRDPAGPPPICIYDKETDHEN